jgi:hypothetical protein
MMKLGNMHASGVHALAVHCSDRWCSHKAAPDVSGYADDVMVPTFNLRMVCTLCGTIGADARPNWNERASPSLYEPPR